MSTSMSEPVTPVSEARRTSPSFPVVGMGASAGGLVALQRFLENMPADNGMAFVIVLHLSPDHESNAPSILQRCTPMPVVQAQQKMALQANHVYVIAPRHALIMEDGHLDVVDRPHTDHPAAIDLFFRTMAAAHGERAFCIVLSGMGSDGAVGLTRVKELGGITLAQLPEDAEYDSMPLAAIATGHTDIVLPVVEMPQRLLNLWRNAQTIRMPTEIAFNPAPPEQKTPEQKAEGALQNILKLLRTRTNHDFKHYKSATILRRLERRLQVRGLPDLVAYCDYLERNSNETELLLQDLLISVTNFFRDRECFDALERDAIPGVFESIADSEPIRAWVAGCATGEEAYSISILLREYADRHSHPAGIQIFATDIDERAIANARAGVYPGAILADISSARLDKYFVREAESYRVIKPIREAVLFAAHNILRDPPFSRLDLICCRNLLIYLDREAQKNVIEVFHFALKPGGYLFLGNSETEDAAPNLFTVVDKKNRIYRANPGVGVIRHVPAFSPNIHNQPKAGTVIERDRRRLSFAHVHQRALETFSSPSVLVDGEYNILHLSASVTRFLAHQGGDPSHNILSNVHPELRLELRTALFKATQTGADVDSQQVSVNLGSGPVPITIVVRHFSDPESSVAALLVIFEELPEADMPRAEIASNPAAEMIVNHLEGEIKRYKQDLQATLERSEISTEELKASNEELQTINEELRSATEELETSKEELQSMNEELITLNYELKRKIEETDASNDYLHNLIASTDIATVFIDRDMCIVRYTPRATDIFKLIPSDHGRPLMDIRHKLDYDALAHDASEAFHNLRSIERKIRGNDDKFYLARVLPYRTKEDKIEGAVLTFIEITALHEAEETIRVGEERLRLAAETTKDYAIITMDEAAIINTWNAGAERCFGYVEAEAIGNHIELIFTPEDRAKGACDKELQNARVFGKAEDERWHLRKNGTTFFCSGVLSVIESNSEKGFVKIARDMTDSKRLQVERDAQLALEKNARLKMQLASDMRDEFLAVMSHELKHPLNLIQVNAELIAHLPAVKELPEIGRSTEVIRRTVLSQAKIIDDLLDLSRARTGKLTLSLAAVNLNDEITSIVHAARTNAESKGIAITLNIGDEPLIAKSDSVRIEQIVWNLLSNSIKFTPEGGAITIDFVRDGSNAKLTVTDNGEGIAATYLKSVFDMFNQGSRPRTRQEGGLGIGLALVRELVQAHNGSVEAHSKGLGQGSSFIVRLPLSDISGRIDDRQATTTALLKGLRILIVDDSQESLDPFAILLRLSGAEVEAVSSGALALGLLERQTFDVMISDIGMDGMDGYQLIAEVRKRTKLMKLPAIALTGYGRVEDAEKALKHGFNAHLPKPIMLDDLKQTIARLRT